MKEQRNGENSKMRTSVICVCHECW